MLTPEQQEQEENFRTARTTGAYDQIWQTVGRCVFCDHDATQKHHEVYEENGVYMTVSAYAYIDGHLMRGIGASELDGLVKPEDIAGMEVYSAGSPKPMQFDSGMSGCGAVVIWTRPAPARKTP